MATRVVQYFADADCVVLAGTITGMFKSAVGPREDRWTGFFCRPLGADRGDSRFANLRFSGHSSETLSKGDVVEIFARPRTDARTGRLDYTYWNIVDVRRAVAPATIRASVRGRDRSVPDENAGLPYRFFGSCAVFALSYLPPDGPHVRAFTLQSGLDEDGVAAMRRNCAASMTVTALRRAFPSAEGTSLMDGLRRLLARSDEDVDAFVARVRERPYDLLGMAERAGMSFRFQAVDRLAVADCGVALDDETRVRLCSNEAFRSLCVQGGHVCWDVSDAGCLSALVDAVRRVSGLASFSSSDLHRVVVARGSGFALSECAGRVYLYSDATHAEEVRAAAAVVAAVRGPSLFADVLADPAARTRVNVLVMKYYETTVGQDAPLEAYEFVHHVLDRRCSVLTGGPGSGKTTAVKCLIYVLRGLLGPDDPRATPVLTAPTGMAAKRLSDSVNSADFLDDRLEARTAAHWVCHLARVFAVGESVAPEIFDAARRDLEGRVVVVDEMSMMDLMWSSAFLEFMLVRFCCGMVFIGDRDQLPSVGYGEVFEHLCMLEPEIPVTALVGSNRVAKDRHVLLENFERVKSGHAMSAMDWSEPDVFARHWFSGAGAGSDEAAAAALVAEYARLLAAGSSPEDVQVLTPVHAGALGTFALSRAIRDLVNPASPFAAAPFSTIPGDEIPGASFGTPGDRTPFRVGDRVVLTKNLDGLMNGERGTVARFESVWSDEVRGDVGVVTVEFEDVVDAAGRPRREEFPVSVFSKHFVPAYATTIHKAQGMEYETVLVACPQAFARPGFGVRNLPFTAMTRARARVEFFGRESAVDAAVRNARALRCSLLAHRVRGLVAER